MLDAGRDPETGRRRQRWQGGFRTKRAAEAELNRIEQGTDAFASNMGLAELGERWLEFFDPKTRRARREIVLPASSCRSCSSTERPRRSASCWPAPSGRTSTSGASGATGRPTDPDSFGHAFTRLAAEAGISPRTRLHDIGHGVATVLLEQQVCPTVACAILGRVRELHDGDLPARHAEDDAGRDARTGIGVRSREA